MKQNGRLNNRTSHKTALQNYQHPGNKFKFDKYIPNEQARDDDDDKDDPDSRRSRLKRELFLISVTLDGFGKQGLL